MSITYWTPFLGCRAEKEMRSRRRDEQENSVKGSEVIGSADDSDRIWHKRKI